MFSSSLPLRQEHGANVEREAVARNLDCAVLVGAIDRSAGLLERFDRGLCRMAEKIVASD
jgi:hypothetical protein